MSQSFWTTLSAYASELAPVAGPLLGAVADTADAIDRAGTQTKSLTVRSRAITNELLLPEAAPPRPRVKPRSKRKAPKPQA